MRAQFVPSVVGHELQSPDATITNSAVERLCSHVAKLIEEPNVGLRLARSTGDLSRFDAGLMMMTACSNLRESLQRMERIQAYWADGARLNLVEVPGGL